jgi:hypothetical protein
MDIKCRVTAESTLEEVFEVMKTQIDNLFQGEVFLVDSLLRVEEWSIIEKDYRLKLAYMLLDYVEENPDLLETYGIADKIKQPMYRKLFKFEEKSSEMKEKVQKEIGELVESTSEFMSGITVLNRDNLEQFRFEDISCLAKDGIYRMVENIVMYNIIYNTINNIELKRIEEGKGSIKRTEKGILNDYIKDKINFNVDVEERSRLIFKELEKKFR